MAFGDFNKMVDFVKKENTYLKEGTEKFNILEDKAKNGDVLAEFSYSEQLYYNEKYLDSIYWLSKAFFDNRDNGYIIIEPQEQDIRINSLNLNKNISTKITISGSISNIKDIQSQNSIGLCRTEFLFMEYKNQPNISDQIKIYQEISKSINNKNLTIRTFDICSDKHLRWFKLNKPIDDNYRSIKICLDNIDIFKAQIKAIILANSNKNISILFPFINTFYEIQQVLSIYNQCKNELKLDNLAFNEPKIGAMIETRTAVENVYEIAKLVDFVSIGTNDLTKSLYNIDRESNDECIDNSMLLDNIKTISEQAHKLNKKVCICGDLASDFNLLRTFEKLNIDELAVPFNILNLYN